MSTTAEEHYREGRLADAVAAATEQVKKNPTDAGARLLLAEMLCFAGDLERADKQFDASNPSDPKEALALTHLRQVLRAEQARRDFHESGRLPEFQVPPSPETQLRVKASISLREGRPEEAAGLLSEAEEKRPHSGGESDGQPFDDFRDLDDLLGVELEVLAPNGKYYWLGVDQVALLEFVEPKRPIDLFWRVVRIRLRNGADSLVYMPALYCGSHAASDDRLRLGRYTDWSQEPGAPVRGIGQRMFLVGDEARSILELKRITFNAGAGEQGHG
jgi:type VI secretion system protein ImpE